MVSTLLILMIVLFLILVIFTGTPIAVALGLSAIAELVMQGEVPLMIAPQRIFNGVNSVTLMGIPFFMLVGSIMERSGITQKLIDFANSLVGWLRGGLCYVCLLYTSVGGDCQIKWLTDNPYRLRPLGLMKAESQIQCARTDLVQDIIGSAFCKMKANLAVFLLLIKSVHQSGNHGGGKDVYKRQPRRRQIPGKRRKRRRLPPICEWEIPRSSIKLRRRITRS